MNDPDPARCDPLVEIANLRAALARADVLARQSAASAAAQALRSGAEAHAAYTLLGQVKQMQASLFWRVTGPLRLAVDLARGAPPHASAEAQRIRRALVLLKRAGPRAVLRRLRQSARARAAPAAERRVAVGAAADAAMPSPGAILAPSVLIIAELTLQQCAKYRVWQKQEHFSRLGIPCRVVDWREDSDCLSAAALATQVIFYRVPGYPKILRLIAHLHALGLPLAWEVDDLIFDRALFLQNRNVDHLDPDMRDGIISGVDLYRSAMLACGAGIASTPQLADLMREAGLGDVMVIENALDAETLALADRLRGPREARPDIVVAYGSGTKTHDADFRRAAPALLRLLRERPLVRLRIIGDLNLPEAFTAFGNRVERLPPAPYASYLELLAECDISIAPLEPTLFNDAKSNIKFLEAAILGIASACSPRAHFRRIVRDGENGLFAEDDAQWFEALCRLCDDAALRARLAEAAMRSALDQYAPAAIACHQVAPLLDRAPDRREAGKLRVLFANIYYAPRSYGGATVVMEEMARRFAARDDTDVQVFTGLDRDAPDQALTRSQQGRITVFSAPTAAMGGIAEFDDPAVGALFGRVLDAARPHIVHLHSLQWLGAGLAAECIRRDIAYVITVHDAWWLCARQFMVRGDGTYCFQTRIDLHVCQNCNPGSGHLQVRDTLLKAALEGAALLLSPGEAHRRLYIANGVPPERIVVAPNGVKLPATGMKRMPAERLRFAYVGGSVEIKGFSLVRRAFEALDRGDWELILVDNTINVGFSSVDTDDWQVRGTLAVVPAYTQDTIDDFFAGFDVLLFPSQWKESFGLTVREALARDVWVIATEGGGPAEAITDGINGTLIPLDGRPESLGLAVTALLNRPDRLAGFRNPFADAIMGYDDQAAALHALLKRHASASTH